MTAITDDEAVPFWVRHFWSLRPADGSGSSKQVLQRQLMAGCRRRSAGSFAADQPQPDLVRLLKEDGLCVVFDRTGMDRQDRSFCQELLRRAAPVKLSSGQLGERVPLADFLPPVGASSSGDGQVRRPLCAATAADFEASAAGRAWLTDFQSFERWPGYDAPEHSVCTSPPLNRCAPAAVALPLTLAAAVSPRLCCARPGSLMLQ